MFSRRLASIVALVPMFVLAACSAATGDGAGDSSEQDIKSAPICGGIAGFQCPADLTCDMGGNAFPDAAGVCKKVICGGIAGLRCPSGLACDMGGKTYPDASGVCKTAAKPVVHACAGFAGLKCPAGLVCDISMPNVCGGADIGGTCIAKPFACPRIELPVCGCNGVTYANDCERTKASAQLDHAGACN